MANGTDTEEIPQPATRRSEKELLALSAALEKPKERLEEPLLEDSKTDTGSLRDQETGVEAEKTAEEDEDADLYWLPPTIPKAPSEPCPQDIQDKVADYIAKQEATGITISSSLRSLPGYRNPDFLQHCVLYDNISEYGTCYSPEIFDPYNLPPEDYYDRLAAEWLQHSEKQRMERSKAQKIEFAKGSSESLARASGSAMTASASLAAHKVSQTSKDKKGSKWDAKR